MGKNRLEDGHAMVTAKHMAIRPILNSWVSTSRGPLKHSVPPSPPSAAACSAPPTMDWTGDGRPSPSGFAFWPWVVPTPAEGVHLGVIRTAPNVALSLRSSPFSRRRQRLPPPDLKKIEDKISSGAMMGSHETPKQKCSRRFLTTCTGVGMSLLDAKHINENSPRFVAKLIAKVEKTGACAGVINEEETSVPNK
ncbi:transposon Tf2-2 polyprotein [Striga asiatica]|uniref:Transposon Tf2-2 polyprotein n=1 Tax=Striga asiatica TaxID=4170 RepID=A0A5A7P9H6_STRAF|nr:transposon Tf2-2 polyprotein [Striga asiatica]